jgi:hemoglobin-like flavoprotein
VIIHFFTRLLPDSFSQATNDARLFRLYLEPPESPMPIYRHPITSSEQPSARKLRAVPLDRELISRLRAVYQAARKNDDHSLAKIFYHKLFAAHPELCKMFPECLDEQASKLMAMFDQVIDGLEHPERNVQLLAELGRRHQGYGVRPEHYPIVVELLTDSMKELLESAPNVLNNENSIEEWRLMLTLISRQMTCQLGLDLAQ